MSLLRLVPIFFALSAAAAVAFPVDGTYHGACTEEGAPAEGASEARLDFPELCFAGACCDLYNPTRLRLLEEEFLYDGNCTADGDEFEARIYFGSGRADNSMVVVLRGVADTLFLCGAEPSPAEDEADEADEDEGAEDDEELEDA